MQTDQIHIAGCGDMSTHWLNGVPGVRTERGDDMFMTVIAAARGSFSGNGLPLSITLTLSPGALDGLP